MRKWINLVEGKWWDAEETITLYHGTSSALVPRIKEIGLCPPSEDLRQYAHEILELYVPREEWTNELLRKVDEHAVRISGGRTGDSGPVLFFFTEAKDVEGYARSYAAYGGEIAADVYRCAKAFYAGNEITAREFAELDWEKKPRFYGSTPVVIEVEVPKAWCIWNRDLTKMKADLDQAWAEQKNWVSSLNSVEELYDEVFENREIRVGRTIPVEMIKSIREIAPEELTEVVDDRDHPLIPKYAIPSLNRDYQADKNRGLVKLGMIDNLALMVNKPNKDAARNDIRAYLVDGGEPIGLLELYADHNAENVFISKYVFLLPEYQRKGLGLKLYEFFMRHGMTLKSDHTHTLDSRRLWDKLARDPRFIVKHKGEEITDTAPHYDDQQSHFTARLRESATPKCKRSL